MPTYPPCFALFPANCPPPQTAPPDMPTALRLQQNQPERAIAVRPATGLAHQHPARFPPPIPSRVQRAALRSNADSGRDDACVTTQNKHCRGLKRLVARLLTTPNALPTVAHCCVNVAGHARGAGYFLEAGQAVECAAAQPLPALQSVVLQEEFALLARSALGH